MAKLTGTVPVMLKTIVVKVTYRPTGEPEKRRASLTINASTTSEAFRVAERWINERTDDVARGIVVHDPIPGSERFARRPGLVGVSLG